MLGHPPQPPGSASSARPSRRDAAAAATRTGSHGGISRTMAPGRACQAKTSYSGASTLQLKVCTIAVTLTRYLRTGNGAFVPARS